MKNIKSYKNFIMKFVHEDHLLLPILVVGAIILFIIGNLFRHNIENMVYRNTVNTMEEVAQHDIKSLQDKFDDSYLSLRIIANEIRHDNCQSIEEAERWLNIRSGNNYFERIGFIDDQYVLYRDDFWRMPLRNDSLRAFFMQNEASSIMDVYEAVDENNPGGSYEVLMYAVKIDPIKIGDRTIIGMSAVHRINAIMDLMKISSFEGNGYSAIVESNGDFLVDVEDRDNSSDKGNLFAKLKSAQITDGNSVAAIQEMMLNKQQVVTRYFNNLGEDRVLLISPLRDHNRYFVMTVSYSFFADRSAAFVNEATMFILAVLLVALIAIFTAYRSVISVVRTEAASKAQNAFLTNMSHEIRTPLNGIIGMNKLMSKHINDSDKLKECLKNAQDTSHYLMGLVNDIFDVGVMTSGKFSMNKRNFDLNNVLSCIVSIQAEKFKDKGITFETDFQIQHSSLVSDDFRIRQAVMNLLSNAYKFTNKGGKVTLSVWQEKTDSHDYIKTVFKCQDNGIGISEDFLPKIFDYFSQDRDMNRASVKGTGLGLFICKHIVSALDGTIEVDSKFGYGTVFTMVIPMLMFPEEDETVLTDLSGEEEQNLVTKEQEEAVSDFEKIQLKADDTDEDILTASDTGRTPIHALIVEDNEMNAMILAELLTDLGVTTDWAMDGEEGFEMFSNAPEGKYDCIFMDIQMPIMNGYDCTRHIRSLDRKDAKSIYICACTANVLQQDEDDAYDSGMNDFIGKPVDTEILMDVLSKLKK